MDEYGKEEATEGAFAGVMVWVNDSVGVLAEHLAACAAALRQSAARKV